MQKQHHSLHFDKPNLNFLIKGYPLSSSLSTGYILLVSDQCGIFDPTDKLTAEHQPKLFLLSSIATYPRFELSKQTYP